MAAFSLFCLLFTAGAPAAPAPAPLPDVRALVAEERTGIEKFFGRPFAREFDIRIADSRAALDRIAAERWKMPATECWMVAMGVADTFLMLAPSDWKAEACEHDGSNAAQVRRIVAHELTHVFHGQQNPRPDFDGMDDAGWFVEGLAVLAAGQLDDARRAQVAKATAAGELPKSLARALSGQASYGVCGSLVEYIDRRWGRGVTFSLLSRTTNPEILAVLGVSEAELLEGWRRSLGRPAPDA